MEQRSSLQRFNQVLLGFLLFFGLLYLGSSFLVPIAIGGLFAMLLVPVCQRLERWKLSRSVAALICVFAVVIILIGLISVLITQIFALANDLPELGKMLTAKLDQARTFATDKFDLSREKQNEYVRNQLEGATQMAGSYIRSFLLSTSSFLLNFVVVITYTLLFLIYRRRLRNFILKLVRDREGSYAQNIVNKITGVASSYISGVFLVVVILAAVNTAGLMIIGIEHALFFGLLAGLLNIIPYIGSIAGSLIPVIFALLTKEALWYPIGVAIFFLVVQQIESYILTPNITGSKIKLSAMATLMVLLLGGMIWGVAGMILFVPYLGILKVVFDNIEKLQPYGYILGNEEEKENPKPIIAKPASEG
ncbi:AI-2E family transporter [Pontibacter qinzhouensis]|uniref:AI-2E family transporter n=1 Tax=Pontibacter qinzhouensis TaxID=2603253 RepID=A0A5C8JHM2_9BACT|nr:AI-2E family transporter [Pontibacter qinzhouensis]TXK36892.1 AI-2E family transporter [Pontibacter qinzhouensis]